MARVDELMADVSLYRSAMREEEHVDANSVPAFACTAIGAF